MPRPSQQAGVHGSRQHVSRWSTASLPAFPAYPSTLAVQLRRWDAPGARGRRAGLLHYPPPPLPSARELAIEAPPSTHYP